MVSALHLVLPPRCICCGSAVASDFGLCPDCWADAGFIMGVSCDACGVPLPGQVGEGDHAICDDCMHTQHPWTHGRAAMRYGGSARKMILGLKHGDRLDLVRPLGGWLARSVTDIITPQMIVAPVPLHRTRLLKRKYNQAALLGRGVAKAHGLRLVPDLLIRYRATPPQEGRSKEARLENIKNSIRINPRYGNILRNMTVLLVDDVMTSGATFTVCATALREAGASEVRIAALARVANNE